MLKKFASKIPDLEVPMQAGEVSIRQTLQAIEPFAGNREAWLFNVSRKTGLPKNRVRSLFYNRQCRLWADELTKINRAISAHHSEAVRLLNRQGELNNETIAEIRSMVAKILAALPCDDSGGA